MTELIKRQQSVRILARDGETARQRFNLNGINTPLRSSPESFAATSEVAEPWGDSWRDHQLAEAGPAEGVSQDMASVLIPLGDNVQCKRYKLLSLLGL